MAQTFRDFRNDNQQDLQDTTSYSRLDLHDYDQEASGRNDGADFEPSGKFYFISFLVINLFHFDEYIFPWTSYHCSVQEEHSQ